MAEQRVVLDFFINGTSRIDQLVNKVSQLEGVVNSLNQVPLEINVKKATSQFERLDSELRLLESTLKGQKASFGAANKSINDQQKAIDKSGASIEKYQDQLVSIQRQLQSLNPGTKKYNDLLDRQNKIIKDYASAQSDLAEAQDKLLESQKNKSIIGERLDKAKIKLESGQKLQSEAKRFKQLTEALDGLASQYLELGIAQKKAKETTPLASGLDIRAARPRTQENPSIVQLNSQANALDLIAKNSSIASSQFNRFTIASEVASQRIYEAGQQKLKALAFGLSKEAQSVNIGTGGPKSIAAARNTIDSLIGSYGGIVKSEAALSSYISRLQSLQSLVPYLSEEYNRLERAIGDVSAEMESLQRMTQLRGAVSKIQPQAGPASLLPKYSIESSAKQYKYQEDLEKKKEALLDKQSGILEKINDSLLSEGRKKAFNLEIDKATELLASNQLEEAQKLTKEIQKQVNERLKLFKGPKTQVFGALGTGFLPVSGGLPSGEMAPGSPKSRIKGPSRELYSTRAFQEQLAFEKAISDQQAKQIAIGQRISQSTARERDKKKLFIQLEQASAALAEGRLEDTIRITREIDKQRFSFERQRKAEEARMPAYRTGVFSPASGPRQLKNTLASGAIIEQSLINLQNQGADVTSQLVSLQNALNTAKQKDYEISLKNLTVLSDQVADAGKYAQLQQKIISGGRKVGAGAIELGGFAEVQERARYDKLINDLRKTYNKTLTSGQTIEQTLINLKGRGADVDKLLIDLQETLNNAKREGLDTDEDAVLKLVEQITLTRQLAQLEARKLANKDKEGKTKEPGSGLTAALEKLREARAARVSFLGEGVSPAEAIDKIVREFNTGKSKIGNTADNIVQTFISKLTGGSSRSAQAGRKFAEASTDSIEDAYGIASPSRFMIEVVKNLVDTYVREMQKSYPRIKAATAKAFGEETLLRDVTKLRATNRGFEEYGRPSTGFKPFPLGADTPGATSEFNDLMRNWFRRQIAELTTQPEIYGNMLNALPNSRITTDLIGVANRRALASEIPSFMSTQRMLGPGELERFISSELAKYLKDIKIPNPWIGPIGDYKAFIAKVISETDKLRVTPSGIRSLPQGQIAGLLPEGVDISSRFEARLRQVHERSAERGARVLAEDAATRLERAYEAAAAAGGRFLPPSPPVPPGGGGGAGGAGDRGAAREGQRLLTLADALINQASINELEALTQELNQFRNALNPTIEGFDLLDSQLRETINNIGDVLESRAPGTDPLMRRFPGRRGRAISEGLIGGAFPLLFGQGVGASVGGGLGGAAGALVGGGLGFGLSLVGTAIGAELDKAVTAAGQLNSAFLTVAGSYSEIRKQGIQFTAELENQVNLLKRSGDFAAATQLERGSVQGATGDINAAATEGVAAAGAVLSATWNDTYKSIQTTLGIIASPFLFALNALLTPVKALFQGFNAIASLVANIPGVREVFAGWNEQAYKTTQEYQDQLAEIQKQINEAGKLNSIREEGLVYLRASLGLGQAEAEIMNRTAEAAKRRAENQKEIEKIRVDNPSRTAEQRNKINELVYEQQRKFLAEEKAIAITNAQEVYQEAVELNRSLNRQKIDNELRYRDLIVSRIREQRDLDLENSRKAQDILLEAAQKRLAIEEKINQQKLEASRIATQSLQIDRGLSAIGKPVAQGVNEFLKAIDEYGLKLQQINQEYYQAQKAKQLELIQIQIQFERNKFDLAVRVSRINIDTQKQVASINREINRQNEDVSRKQLAAKLQANLQDIKYQDRLARASYELNKAGMMSALQKSGGPDFAAAQLYKENMDYAYNTVTQFAPIIADLQVLVSRVSSMKTSLPEIGNVPSLNYDTSGVDKAQADLVAAAKSGADFKSFALNVVNESRNLGNQLSATLSGALQQFDQIIQKSQNDYDIRKKTVQLIQQGVNPAIVEQIASLDQAYETQKNIINSAIEELEARVASNKALLIEVEALVKLRQLIKDKNSEKYKALDIEINILNARILGNNVLEKELKKLRERAKLLDPNYQEAGKSIIDSTKPVEGEKIATAYADATRKLDELINKENQAIFAARTIGDAFGQVFREIAAGTATAQEILSGFFQNLANSFADMAAQIIAEMIRMYILKQLLNLFGGGSPFLGDASLGGTDWGAGGSGTDWSQAPGIIDLPGPATPFAMGGVVNSPTLFKFANGGAMNTGVMGEAGPEAILPLSRGSDGKLGVSASGSGGDVNVTVNVDAKGTSVQGNDQSGNQLGRAISAAVQQEIIKQRRPGGLLNK